MEEMLKNFTLLEGVDIKKFLSLYRIENALFIPKEEYLFHQNDISNGMYIIASGELDIILEGEYGVNTWLATIGAGNPLGEMSLLIDQKRSTSARAKSDAELLLLKSEDFKKNIAKNEPTTLRFCSNIAKILSKRLTECLSIIVDMEEVIETKGMHNEIALFRERLIAGGLF